MGDYFGLAVLEFDTSDDAQEIDSHGISLGGQANRRTRQPAG